MLSDPEGNELCLRPDLTIPICRMHLSGGKKFPARLSYHGPAFRFQPGEPDRPSQFLQTGVECLGVPDRKSADVEVLTLAVEGVRAASVHSAPDRNLTLFAGLIDALDIPHTAGPLKRHFDGLFRELLERLSNGASVPGERYLAHLGTASEADARAALTGLMDYLGGTPMGGRTREEIVERLMEQAAEAAAIRLDTKAVALIERVHSVSGPARESIAEIRALLKKNGVKLEAPLAVMEARIAAMEKTRLRSEALELRRALRPQHEYYTGFVFELWSRDSGRSVQIAGGGPTIS